MWFDAQRALAEIQAGPPATIATLATNPTPKQAFVAIVAEVAAPPAQITQPTPMPTEPARSAAISPHGASIAGHPITWTGRIVSLDAWRQVNNPDRQKSNPK